MPQKTEAILSTLGETELSLDPFLKLSLRVTPEAIKVKGGQGVLFCLRPQKCKV